MSLNLRVFIVESPSTLDLYKGRHEGTSLCSTLNLSDIPCDYRLCADKVHLKDALNPTRFKDSASKGENPVLHISAHGNVAGIVLTSGETLNWVELHDLIRPINDVVGGSLLLGMSSCKSSWARLIATSADGRPPFLAMVTNSGSPMWSETAVGFCTFYHLMQRLEVASKSPIEVMKDASGNANFELVGGQQAVDFTKVFKILAEKIVSN